MLNFSNPTAAPTTHVTVNFKKLKFNQKHGKGVKSVIRALERRGLSVTQSEDFSGTLYDINLKGRLIGNLYLGDWGGAKISVLSPQWKPVGVLAYNGKPGRPRPKYRKFGANVGATLVRLYREGTVKTVHSS